MDITLTTNPDMAGRFNRSEHFIITHEVINGFGDSVKNSFTFTIDADIILRDGKIRYEVEDVYTPYDNQYHSIDVKVLSHLNGFKIKYFSFELIKNADGEYVVPNDFNKDSIPWESVTETAPKFKDVGYYRVYFQITVNGENTEIDYADVHIDVADSFILFSELGLDRVYDGVQMGDAAIKSRIKGGYNGNSGQLVFTWFNADDLDNALPYEPYTVGTYAVKVTSNGDNNPAVIQNYTPLNEIYFFEITPATLTLVINSDLVVTGPTDIASKAYIKDNTHRTEAADNDKESILYGLKGSDYLEYDLEFIGHPLEIKIYEHFDKSVPIDSDKLTNFYSDKFTFIWNAYKNNGLTVDNISSNYKLYLDFKLNVHYPNAETKVRNRTFEYTGNPYFFYDGTNGDINSTNNLMMVTFPNVAALTHGDQYSVYYRTSKAQDSEWILARSADDLGFVNPGTYTIYYKVEFNTAYGMYYTPATGSVELTINLQQRVVEASIEKDKLVYNAQKRGAYKDEIIHYDEYGKSIRDYININVTVGNTPNRAEWDILFYDAMKAIENGEEKWIPTGLPYKEIIDAGHYMVELTLPANELYAKTVLYLYLHYTPRNMHVVPTDPSTSFKMNYTGASWRYDVANDPSNFFDTQNLVLGHSLAAATIVCDAVEVGTYTSGFGFETINPGDFVILDASGNDVTHNYAYEINNLSVCSS